MDHNFAEATARTENWKVPNSTRGIQNCFLKKGGRGKRPRGHLARINFPD